ncbi:uncharacterized protein LOC133654277 [Entelurus aequoreus]|uniref:uncharacterized protein LOC133654277 n=1 Tax=Entelurus aequoreus TaxID=161455 RepID=UPI002B1D15E9|nr:uncharacterized protein LOC133654277 [Entelurus aequoreus]
MDSRNVLPYGIRSQLECISRAVLLSQPGDIPGFLEVHLAQMKQSAGEDLTDLKEVAFRYQEQWENDFLVRISKRGQMGETATVRLSTSSVALSKSLTLFEADNLSIPLSVPYEEIPLSATVDTYGSVPRKKSQQALPVRIPSQKETKPVKKTTVAVQTQLPYKAPSQGTQIRVCSEYTKDERKGLHTLKHPQPTLSPNSQKTSLHKKSRGKKSKIMSDSFNCSLEDCLYHKPKDQSDQDKKLEGVQTTTVPTVHRYRGVKKPEVGPGSEIRVPYRPKGGMIFDPELLPQSPKV